MAKKAWSIIILDKADFSIGVTTISARNEQKRPEFPLFSEELAILFAVSANSSDLSSGIRLISYPGHR